MSVQGLGPQNGHAVDRMNQRQDLGNHAEKSSIKDMILAQRSSESSEPPVEGVSNTKGVIQNIQAGHFRGVADVRLRINFHEEIEKQKPQEVTERFEEEAEALDTKIAEKVVELKENFGFAAEFSYSFSFIATTHQSRMANPTEPDDLQPFGTPSIIDMFRKTFEGVFDALSTLEQNDGDNSEKIMFAPKEEIGVASLLETAAPQSPAPEIAEEPPNDTTEELSDFQKALGSLKSFFESELRLIEERLSEVLTIPSLSPPRGNGVAYDRFLGMYNELHGFTENIGEELNPGEQDTIDTSA